MNTLLHPAVLLRFDLIRFSRTLPELAERSLRLLGQIIDQAHEGIPDKLDFASPPEFIYLHARNIRALGKDVLALEAQTQSRGSRILVRSMSESLFALVAAAKDPEFPASKVIAELVKAISTRY
jgi:hypothetical protein